MITDDTIPKINSQLIVTLAKQALSNIDSKWIKDYRKSMQQHDFRYMFGTVKISLPRRSGHTTAALQLLFEYPDSLLFVYRQSLKDEMRRMIREYISDNDVIKRVEDSIIVISDNALKNIRPVGSRPFVIFDQTSKIRQDVYEYIKEGFNAEVIVELQ